MNVNYRGGFHTHIFIITLRPLSTVTIDKIHPCLCELSSDGSRDSQSVKFYCFFTLQLVHTSSRMRNIAL